MGGRMFHLWALSAKTVLLVFVCVNLSAVLAALDHTQRLKTGTTIVGVVCEDAVVLAADTRSTMGAIVADKNCEKIHKIAPSIYCCGAGTAAHAERITMAAKTWLRLEQLKSVMSASEFDEEALPCRVGAAATGISRVLARRQELSAAFVLGGWDPLGLSLYQIESDGTAEKVRFTALGSGSFAAMSLLEARYRCDLSVSEGTELVVDAITSGILNDLGSGSNVDVCIIRRDKKDKNNRVEYRRGVVLGAGGSRARASGISLQSLQGQGSKGAGHTGGTHDVEVVAPIGVPKRRKRMVLVRGEAVPGGTGLLSGEGAEKGHNTQGEPGPSVPKAESDSLKLCIVEADEPDDEIEMM